jgi:hypothetical protein
MSSREARVFALMPFVLVFLMAILSALLGCAPSQESQARHAARLRFQRWCYNKGRVPIQLTRDEWLCVLPEQAHGR